MAKARDRNRRAGAAETRASRSERPTAPPEPAATAPGAAAESPKLAANRAARQAAKANRDAARRSEQRRRTLVRGGIIAAIATALVAFIVLVAYPGADLGQSQRYEGSGHVEDGTPLSNANRPPSSGPHYAGRAPYGLSTTPLHPGHWIHVLEHGGMVVLYRCGDDAECEQKGNELKTAVYDPAKAGKFGERKITITPYQDMDAPITAVVWGRVLPLQTVDAEQMLAFYNRYLDRGPEDAA